VSCSVHLVSERHRHVVQSARVRRWGRPCDAGSGKRTEQKLPASVRRSHRACCCDASASRCQQRGGWTTRVSAPYIDSSVGALSAGKCPPGTLALGPGIAPWFGHRRVAGRSQALRLMQTCACECVCSLPCCCCCCCCCRSSVRLGGTAHSSSKSALLVLRSRWYG
jgi:hypothetical protein